MTSQRTIKSIAAMRAERNARAERTEAHNISAQWKASAEIRDDAAVEGDLATFEEFDKDCEALEKEWANLPQNKQQQPAYLTPENAQYVARFGNLDNPVNRAKFEQFVMTAERAGLDLSDHSQFREGVEKFMSPGVFQNGQLVPGTEGPIVPVGAEPMPDRNEAFEIANNSKYGCDPKDFVKGERELHKRKAAGFYPDSK
jgi:hypothetical protein